MPRCPAGGAERSWDRAAWISGEGICPDCGGPCGVWARGTDLFPKAKVRAHDLPDPLIVQPGPYALDGKAGHARPAEVSS